MKQDIRIHDATPALQFIKMPAITANEHCRQLRERARAVLQARPPKGPTAATVDLMYSLDNLQRRLVQVRDTHGTDLPVTHMRDRNGGDKVRDMALAYP